MMVMVMMTMDTKIMAQTTRIGRNYHHRLRSQPLMTWSDPRVCNLRESSFTRIEIYLFPSFVPAYSSVRGSSSIILCVDWWTLSAYLAQPLARESVFRARDY